MYLLVKNLWCSGIIVSKRIKSVDTMYKNLNEDKKTNINRWNSKAKDFSQRGIPSIEEDLLLSLLVNKNMISSDSVVLDVGCGTGQHALALAKMCKKVVGIDISPDMVEIAKGKAKLLGIENVEFLCMDFEELDVKEADFYKKFDVCFANRCPAIVTAEDFRKLTETSKSWCVVTKHKKEEESISNNVKSITDGKSINGLNTDILSSGFDFLIKNNYSPQLEYNNEKWDIKGTLDEFLSISIADAKTSGMFSPEVESELKSYLSAVSSNNIIEEYIDVTIISMYWKC